MGRPGDNAATVLDAFMPSSLGAVNIERKRRKAGASMQEHQAGTLSARVGCGVGGGLDQGMAIRVGLLVIESTELHQLRCREC